MTSSPSRQIAPPRGGRPPPAEALVGGERVWLGPAAEEVARRYHDEYPDERERYGAAGYRWCVHDNQYLLHWASLSEATFASQLDWLAGVLEARAYPLARLARDLELAAAVAEELWAEGAGELAARLRAGAARIRD